MDALVACSATEVAMVVWEDAAPEQTPNILQTWAAARGLRLVSPNEGGLHAIAVDPSVATRVEEDLHAAHELVARADADGVERALARAEALLRAHPELPQGAWLLAEVERGWATRFARLAPTETERAARHWRAAAALDGGRAAGVGEPSAAPDREEPFSIDVLDGGSVELRWDGDVISPGAHEARPGVHQLVAVAARRRGVDSDANGAVVFAQWVTVAHGTNVRVALPTAEPCSLADLDAKGAVQCPSWIAARRGDRAGTFVVRSCVANACGAELLVAPISYTPEKPPVVKHGLPAWAVWTLTGAGIAAAAALASVIGYYALPATTDVRWVTTKPQ